MNIRKRITYFALIFLVVIITYYFYYGVILTIISNNCTPIAGGLIKSESSFLVDFFNFYKMGENYICLGHINLFRNSKLTFSIYILFSWLIFIPFVIKKFELRFKYKNLFFILGIVIIILFIIFFIINTHYLKHGFPTVKW